MITYELAKKLKDAGFKNTEYKTIMRCREITLSELIEACGDKFLQIMKMPKGEQGEGWWAYKYPATDMPSGIWGSTPEEAVSKLWLKLKKI